MKRRLYRSEKDKVIAGVIGGLAEYFNQDVVAWRLAVILLIILTGLMPGILFYLLAATLIPTKGNADYIVE